MRSTILAGVLAVGVIGGGAAVYQNTSAPQQASTGCGVERWSVKTLADPDANMVRLNTTVWASPHSLGSLPAPATLPADARIAPVEDTVYRESVTLVKFKREADSDIHLVIAGSADREMIAEIPSPACVQITSPARSRIAAARAAFEAHFGAPTGTWHTVNVPVKLTGVGFFDFKHGQTGVAPDGVELHPVLSIAVR